MLSYDYDIKYSVRLENLVDLEKAVHLIETLVEAHSIPADVAYAIQIVVDEICVNFCNYGKPKIKSECYQDIGFLVNNNSVKIIFSDNGNKFNPLTVPPADPYINLPLEERPVGGLGIHFVRYYADNLAYEYIDGLNNLVFEKLW